MLCLMHDRLNDFDIFTGKGDVFESVVVAAAAAFDLLNYRFCIWLFCI